MRDYRKYRVWELGHEITLKIYGIISQMRRSSYSIPANIVEGCGRESDAEFKRFLIIAPGSANELEYFTMLAKDLGYLDIPIFTKLNDYVDKTRRSLNSLIKKL